jgi:ribulose-5-phosphate 4-epimerase/fuculose-1-phosphate aldolase
VGRSVAEAFHLMYYLDLSCQIQVDALAGGRVEVRQLTASTAHKVYQQFLGPGGAEIEKEWSALLRLLERQGVAYRV